MEDHEEEKEVTQTDERDLLVIGRALNVQKSTKD